MFSLLSFAVSVQVSGGLLLKDLLGHISTGQRGTKSCHGLPYIYLFIFVNNIMICKYLKFGIFSVFRI